MIAPNFLTSEFVATVTSQRPLWNLHTSSAGGIDLQENKDLLYKYLYYSDFSEKDMANAVSEKNFEIIAVLFGSERALPELANNSNLVTTAEIQGEIKKYSDFIKNFSKSDAENPTISYLIVPEKSEVEYANIDRWYERGDGEVFGLFRVYTLKLK